MSIPSPCNQARMSCSKQVVQLDIRMKLGLPFGASALVASCGSLLPGVDGTTPSASCRSLLPGAKELGPSEVQLKLEEKNPNPLKSARASQNFLVASQREFVNPCKIPENICSLLQPPTAKCPVFRNEQIVHTRLFYALWSSLEVTMFQMCAIYW